MQNLPQLILETFETHWPTLRDNPTELAARLQRRRRAMLNRPPRAWCIALRASDTRMTPFNTIFDDYHAPDARRPHAVTVDAALVRRLVAPVTIHPPGEPWTDVAARLGVHEESLRRAMTLGRFAVHHIPPFSRRPGSTGRGKPVPLLYHPGPLNPCAENHARPDPAWGSLWPYHADLFTRTVPADFSQTLQRTPRLRPYTDRRYGTDAAPTFRFRGWTWLCPACHRPVEMIYLPLPVPDVASYMGLEERVEGEDVRREMDGRLKGTSARCEEEEDAEAAATVASSLTPHALRLNPLSPPLPTFACVRCHRVRYLTRTSDQGWNELVNYLTAGLLYGREVPKPADWHVRRREYRRHQRALADTTA